jgi:hypothetical protein
MRISRVTLIPIIAVLGVAGTVLAAPAMAAPTVHHVYVHSSKPQHSVAQVYVHS